MTEYEIRLAVAEYDEDLAQLGDWEFGSELYCENESTYWRIQDTTMCEGRAIGAGQLGAQEIGGRAVMFSPQRGEQ